ncbi:MAG: FAD-dependent oxidoreductase [Firmicutes bacterium]|nr:FAD-dependent oxidoreductase [Bacillota bacterium]
MYDVIVIGCGPAGMTSAIYAARANKKVLILEKETIGGQMASAPLIENYPGYSSISGSELASKMFDQIMELDVDFELEEVTVIIDGKVKKVVTDSNTYDTKTIIVATGSKYRLLGLENEEDLIGKGIHFCTSCDGIFFKDKTVAVIGGGNSAVINAITMSDICKKVYVIQNLEKLTAENILIDKLNRKDNVEIITSATVKKINGEDILTGIVIEILKEEKEILLDGMFISIGLVPQSELVKNVLNINQYGYIESNNCKTDIQGIFVAGDCRDKAFRQITISTSDGTVAATEAINYLNNN